MSTSPLPAPPDTSPTPLPEAGPPQLALVEALLDAALQARRAGRFADLVAERPRLVRWLLRRHGRVVRAAAGDALQGDALHEVADIVLRWLVVRLRPDAAAHLEHIGEEAWLHLTAWRPLLAVASTCGLLPIPDFPRAYRRRAHEAPLDNLCGLWSVGSSTVYRVLERGRRQMAQALLETRPDVPRELALREHVMHVLESTHPFGDEASRRIWHARQASRLRDRGDATTVLWHLWQAGDVAGFIHALRRLAGALAADPVADALMARVQALPQLPARARVDLWLARGALERSRGSAAGERAAYERARDLAQEAHDPLLLGLVHGALGRYYDSRDTDHALACYQDSAEFLREQVMDASDAEALGYAVTTYARLAWFYLRRNDPRSKAVLDHAEAVRQQHAVPDDAVGFLEVAWGEYCHRAGDRTRSLEHRYRALNIFERLGDERSVLASHVSIAHDLAGRGEHRRAIAVLERALAAIRRGGGTPEIAASTHINMSLSLMEIGDLDGAIQQGEAALETGRRSGLQHHMFLARVNLAEAHFKRYLGKGDPADEAWGDVYVRDGLAVEVAEVAPTLRDLLRGIKQQVMGAREQPAPDRLMPQEDAAHFDEMVDVHQHRAVLALPGEPRAHAQAHLAIAKAYTAIATKEREAALALIDKHGLREHFVGELDALRQTFERELTREQQLAAAWKQAAADLVDDARRAALIAHLLKDGAVNKSAYGDLCGVAPATASKHLGLLMERGLLVQRGKGPATRYELPSATGG